MIFCHLAIALSALSQAWAAATRTAIADPKQVCLDVEIGTDMPNPYDCQSYFSCATVPFLRFCDAGLHFDGTKKVCTTPEEAKCIVTLANGKTDGNTNATDDIDWWYHRPRPVFLAVDIMTGQPTDPMAKYDPKNIECRHLGAYFLPHPTNCQRYFICAYGHLHHHRCGRGTFWHYKHSECQLSEYALCYNNATASYQQGVTENTIKQTVVSPTTSTLPITTTNIADEQSSKPITVCYIINAGEMTLLSSNNNTSVNELNPIMPTAFVATAPPLPTRPLKPNAVTVPPPVATSTARTPTLTVKCPAERQSYLPDPENCAKYFICIAGLPVHTACPTGLYWDQQLGYCDLAQNVKCITKKII